MVMTFGKSPSHSSLASRKMRRQHPNERFSTESSPCYSEGVFHRAAGSLASPESLRAMQNRRLYLDLLTQVCITHRQRTRMHTTVGEAQSSSLGYEEAKTS